MDKEQAFKWAEEVPMDELYDYLRKLTGLSDLKFTTKIEEDRYGNPRIKFKSQDLVDKVGFLKLMFSSIVISQFNSEIKFDADSNDFYFWGTVSFSYDHPSGGSNGCTFCTFWYKNKHWTFDNR